MARPRGGDRETNTSCLYRKAETPAFRVGEERGEGREKFKGGDWVRGETVNISELREI